MATEPKVNVASANSAANSVVNTLSSGFFGIFSGTTPATADTSGGTLLALLAMSSTAASTAASGVCTWNAITSTTAINTGTAGFFRAYVAGATTGWSSGGVFQGLVATSAADMNFNSVAFSSGASVAISSFTYTQKTS